MGQTQGQSLRDVVAAQAMQSPHDILQKHAAELRHIALLSYDGFLSSITEINKLTQTFNDATGKKLVFQLKDGTTTTIFWKVTARILCHKVNCQTEKIESSRVLRLKQYIRLYNEIAQHVSLVTQAADTAAAKIADIRASTIFAELDDGPVKAGTAEVEECCICMEAEAVVILPCVHTYCEDCIEKWSADHKTCPICRAVVNDAGDRWVLTETPDSTEMAVDMADYLVGVADRSGCATAPAPHTSMSPVTPSSSRTVCSSVMLVDRADAHSGFGTM